MRQSLNMWVDIVAVKPGQVVGFRGQQWPMIGVPPGKNSVAGAVERYAMLHPNVQRCISGTSRGVDANNV